MDPFYFQTARQEIVLAINTRAAPLSSLLPERSPVQYSW